MISRNDAQVELYIDRGDDKEDENLRNFKQIEDEKISIEESFGEKLEWESLVVENGDEMLISAFRSRKNISSPELAG